MSNIATNGNDLFESRIVTVGIDPNKRSRVDVFKNKVFYSTTGYALGPLMGDVIAVDPTGTKICIVARIGSGLHQDKGYVYTDGKWLDLGPTAQTQSVAWKNGRFICALVGPGGTKLIEQNDEGVIINSTPIPGGTRSGILYHDDIDQHFILVTSNPYTIGPYTLYKPIRRLLNGQIIYTGQKVGDPDILFTTNGSSIAFKSGPQPDHPQFVVVGTKLVVNGGISYSPPYPKLDEEPVPIPPVPPKPIMKKPEVTVTSWTLDELKDGREFSGYDRMNPDLGYSTRVFIKNGSMHMEISNQAGTGSTGVTRPVKKCPEVTPPNPNPPEPNPPIPPNPNPGLGVKLNGKYFARLNGDRMTIIESSEFSLFKRYLDNDHATYDPVVAERFNMGFNTLRVWLLNDSVVAFRNGVKQTGIHPNQYPNFYERLEDFVDEMDRLGFIVELTIFTQTETLMPNQNDQQNHLNRVAAAVSGKTNVLLELVNENNQHDNAVSPNLVRPPGNIIISHGSNGADSTGVRPTWDYELYHTNGLSEWWRKVGHNAMEKANESGAPCISNENTRYPDNDHSNNHAFDAAAGGALLCAGSCFHSQGGKFSRPFDSVERSCGASWIAGANSVPLEFQPGRYARHDDMNGSQYLRVYSKTLNDGRRFYVKIRR